MLIRILVVAICYALSSLGISMSFLAFQGGTLFKLLGVIIIYAWIAHFVMCIAWIRKSKLKWFWPISGSIAGTCGLLSEPFSFVLVFPCVLLAIHILRFYYREYD